MRIWILAFCGIACLLAPNRGTTDNVTQLVEAAAKLKQPVIVVTNCPAKLQDIKTLFEMQFKPDDLRVLTIDEFNGRTQHQKWQLTFYVVFTEEDKASEMQPWCPASWERNQQKGIFSLAKRDGKKQMSIRNNKWDIMLTMNSPGQLDHAFKSFAYYSNIFNLNPSGAEIFKEAIDFMPVYSTEPTDVILPWAMALRKDRTAYDPNCKLFSDVAQDFKGSQLTLILDRSKLLTDGKPVLTQPQSSFFNTDIRDWLLNNPKSRVQYYVGGYKLPVTGLAKEAEVFAIIAPCKRILNSLCSINHEFLAPTKESFEDLKDLSMFRLFDLIPPQNEGVSSVVKATFVNQLMSSLSDVDNMPTTSLREESESVGDPATGEIIVTLSVMNPRTDTVIGSPVATNGMGPVLTAGPEPQRVPPPNRAQIKDDAMFDLAVKQYEAKEKAHEAWEKRWDDDRLAEENWVTTWEWDVNQIQSAAVQASVTVGPSGSHGQAVFTKTLDPQKVESVPILLRHGSAQSHGAGSEISVDKYETKEEPVYKVSDSLLVSGVRKLASQIVDSLAYECVFEGDVGYTGPTDQPTPVIQPVEEKPAPVAKSSKPTTKKKTPTPRKRK